MERKLTIAALALIVLSASLAYAQVSPMRQGAAGSPNGPIAGQVDRISMSPIQEAIGDLIKWKQSQVLGDIGVAYPADYHSLPAAVKDARMEVVRACNLYERALMTPAQQEQFDKNVLDPKGHPLPQRWETMRLKGTLVKALLKATPEQFDKAQKALDNFRSLNREFILGLNFPTEMSRPDRHVRVKPTYDKHMAILESDLRKALNKDQTAEFDKLWKDYLTHVFTAASSVNVNP